MHTTRDFSTPSTQPRATTQEPTLKSVRLGNLQMWMLHGIAPEDCTTTCKNDICWDYVGEKLPDDPRGWYGSLKSTNYITNSILCIYWCSNPRAPIGGNDSEPCCLATGQDEMPFEFTTSSTCCALRNHANGHIILQWTRLRTTCVHLPRIRS